jgi:hypothetical protein
MRVLVLAISMALLSHNTQPWIPEKVQEHAIDVIVYSPQYLDILHYRRPVSIRIPTPIILRRKVLLVERSDHCS